MKWSFQIIKIFGIPIKIHLTFFLLPLIVLFSKDGLGGLRSGIFGLLMIIVLFIIVVIHELSHSIVARSFGAKIRDITLLPIGGVARMEEMPENPGQEIFIAAAGPASNFILASAVFIAAAIGGRVSALVPGDDAGLLSSLFVINIMLGVFNLIPAFPMDGGRILRGFLAAFLPYLKATNIAAALGQLLAVIAIVADIFFLHSWWFVIIGLFIFLGAEVEEKAVEVKTKLENLKVRDVMVTHVEIMHSSDTLAHAQEKIRTGFQEDFPIMEGERLIGLLTKASLLSALQHLPHDSSVCEALRPELMTASADDPLGELYRNMISKDAHAVAVTENEVLIGMITLGQISKYLLFEKRAKK